MSEFIKVIELKVNWIEQDKSYYMEDVYINLDFISEIKKVDPSTGNDHKGECSNEDMFLFSNDLWNFKNGLKNTVYLIEGFNI